MFWPRHRTGDRGATAIEYVGAVVVAVTVVLALFSTGPGMRIAGGFSKAICRVLGGDCGTDGPNQGRPKTDEDFKPTLCNTSNHEDTVGGKVKIAFLEFGNEYSFKEQRFLDNSPEARKKNGGKPAEKVYLTFNDAASADAKLSKPGVSFGKLGEGDVELGGGVKVTNGDTWVFDSKEEADKFRDDLQELEMAKQTTMVPDAGPYAAYQYAKKHEEVEKTLGNKHISFAKADVHVGGEAALKESTGSDDLGAELEAKLGIKGKLTNEVVITKNNAVNPPITQRTYSVEGEYDAAASAKAGPMKVGGEIGQKYTGTITVSRYEDGTLARIDMSRSVDTRGKASGGADDKGKAEDSDKASTLETTTNSLVFPKDDKNPETVQDRKTAEDWLSGGSKYGSPWVYAFGGDKALKERPGKDDAFGRMAFERGISSRTVHDGITDAQEYGFEVNLELALGASFRIENEDQKIRDAEFLGAPKEDGTRGYLPYGYCAN
ncbi:hypothetical protein [Streptomyces sp. NPDC005438]|uniref:hypothetical protein n=1 Tax=Streptomyces sp. NPDC005438 TaxID=3156880 RepID=UPI0033A8237B